MKLTVDFSAATKETREKGLKFSKHEKPSKCWQELCALKNAFEEKLLIKPLQASKINTLPKPTSIKGTYKLYADIYQNEGKSPHMENLRLNNVTASKIKKKIFVISKKSL